MTARIVILASGNGSNAQAVIDAEELDATVVAVVSDRPEAFVLERAVHSEVPAVPFPRHDGEARLDYDTRLCAEVLRWRPDVVVLAGWMRILTMSFLGGVGVPVVNLHPALPGEFPGTRAIERAFAERVAGRTSSGVMVHLVPDEGVDVGPVLGTAVVPIEESDTFDTFAARMHEVEHRLLVTTLKRLLESVRERL